MGQGKKEKTQAIIIIVLLVVLAGAFLNTKIRMAAKSRPTKDVKKKAGQIIFDIKTAKENLSKLAKAKVVYDGAPYRDPLEKPIEVTMLEGEGAYAVKVPQGARGAGEAKKALVLEGIIWGGPESLAIISGEVVSEGETVNSAKVIKISKDKVVLKKGGREIELKR